MKCRALEAVVVVALAALATGVLTYPLAFGAGDMGRLRLHDARWSIWVVAWVAHALTTEPSRVYDANIFYPHRRALAFSEGNLGAGLIAAPVYFASRNPIAAHNAAMLASFLLAAVATYYLARRLTANRAAAAAAAIAFAFCAYVLSHTTHIQLLMTAGLPLTLLALDRFIERRSPARAATLGAVIAAQALSCAYYGILAGLLAAFGILFFAASRGLWRDRAYWSWSAGAALLSVALVTPFFLPYLEAQRESGFARSLQEARVYSADWRSYLASAGLGHRWLLPWLRRWGEPLFPGFLPVVLGAAGVWLGLRRSAGERRPSRDVVAFYAALGGMTFWLSLGPAGGLYTVFFRLFPIFSFLRAPSRFGVAVTLALAILMAMAIDELARRRRAVRYAALVLPFAVAAELSVIPIRFERMPPVPAVYSVLAGLPRGPVAEFPFYADWPDIQFHALYMLFSTYHWQPLINGYTDNIPRDFYPLAATLRTFPSAEAFDALREREARYLIVHFPRYAPEQRPAIADGLQRFGDRLKLLMRADTIELYEIVR